MQGTANVSERMQAGPEGGQGNLRQSGAGPVYREQAMRREEEMRAGGVQDGREAAGRSAPAGSATTRETGCACKNTGTTQQGGYEEGYAYGHPYGAYPGGSPQPFHGPGPSPGVAGTGPVHQSHQMPGGPYSHGTAGFQGMPCGMSGPQGVPPGVAGHPGTSGAQEMFQGMTAHPGMSGAQRMPPGMTGHHPSCHGPHDSGPGASQAGYHQPCGPGNAPHAWSHQPVGGMGHHPQGARHGSQFMGLVSDIANGKADPSQMMDFLGSLDTQFWKGALVGVSATLLLTNETVKNAIIGTLAGIFGAFSKDTKEEQSTEQ